MPFNYIAYYLCLIYFGYQLRLKMHKLGTLRESQEYCDIVKAQ